MANISTVASGVGKFSNGLLGRLLRFKWSYIFIVVLFIQAISVGINSGNEFGIITALGERFFNMFQNLSVTSNQIIESNAVFDGYLAFLGVIWTLFSNVWLIYLWLKLFAFLWGLYNDSQKAFSWGLSILTMYVLQIGYLFFMRYEVGAEFLISYGFFDILKIPYTSFLDFIKAVVLIFSSTSFNKISPIIEDASNLTNVCTNLSGCVI